MIDVAVVGAGPAGLTAAMHAALAGLETVVIDSRLGDRLGEEESPIDKACGEGLMPGAVAGLRGLGVDIKGHPIAGIRYLRGDISAQARFRQGPGAGVRRVELHKALRDRATELGVQFMAESVTDVSQDESSVTAAGVRARYLVAADGLHSPIRRRLGLDAKPAGQRRWGLRQHFTVYPWTDLVEVHWAGDCEAYVTPVADGLIGVAILSSRRASFDELLSEFPLLQQRLPATGATAVRGAGPLRQASTRRVAGRVLLVGDAAGYVDALTGEGIAVSQACAAALAGCLAADRPADYERQWNRASRRYRLITESLLWARNKPALYKAIVPAARRAPWVFSAAVGQLAR